MGYIEQHTSKGQLTKALFQQVNVAANQSAVALTVAGVSGATTGVPASWDGEVVAVSFALSAAGTAGVFTMRATVNGTAAGGTLTVGTATSGTLLIPRGSVRFKKNDVIGVKVTTDGSWDGTTADLVVTVAMLEQLAGI